MPNLLKHAFLLALALPVSFVGYHLLYGAPRGNGQAEAATRSLVNAVNGFSLGGGYQLSDLEVLKSDLYYVEQRYVEKDRLDPEEMFQAALDMVERQVNEVMFVREPRGRRLQISVGGYSTVLLVEPIVKFDDLSAQLQRVAAVLEDHLSPEIDRAEVEYALVNGALSTLDPHSILLPPVAAREMDVDNQGEFGGLGIEITVRDGKLIVKQPLEGTPAARAGLKADDHIIRIEDESTINMDLEDAVSRLRGEVGTEVTILVKRKQLPTPREFRIVRAVIRLNPVEGELLEGNVGYVRIKSFNQNVASDLEELLARFRRESMGDIRGLVLDLRGNPGGYLNQAVEVANKFLDEGVIVATVEGAGRRRDEQRASRAGTEPAYPIAVLVNGSSASASEIVAGALRNQGRSIILGERTFGKGSVQHLYNNKDHSKLKLTVAKYLTPGDHSIQSVGIPPDIQLVPSIVRPPEAGAEDPNAMVSLYWREWLDREVSLDHHLENAPADDAGPAYSVRYLRPESADEQADKTDPKRDWEVEFARQVLLTAGSGARRVEVLQAAAPVVTSYGRQQSQALVDAFGELGIDWSEGANPTATALEVRVLLGDDDAIVAGAPEDVTVEVTNRGVDPLYRVSAVSSSDNAWLDHREFYFGRIDPGQTRRFSQRVVLQEGYGDEVAPMELQFRDQDSHELARYSRMIRTKAQPLPRFEYTVKLLDDGSGTSRGNGDGRPDPGEVVDLVISVTNVGEGPTSEGFARVKNRSGRALDLTKGSIPIGEPRTAAGKPCEPDTEGCSRRLDSGQTATGRVSFELRELPSEGTWSLDLLVGDNQRYDYAAVQRGGFYDYFQLTETLELAPGVALPERVRRPPVIEISRAPALEGQEPDVVVSGIVNDDEAIRDVMVFHDDEKVFYRGGDEGARALPFSVEPRLKPGTNLVYVLARDRDGLVATRAIDTLYRPPEATAERADSAGD